MLELREIATVFSGISARESKVGSARLMRLADLTDLKAGRVPAMLRGEPPEVARALPIEEGDLIVAARGSNTDVFTANDSIFGAYISLDLYLVRPQPERINSDYLRAVLELPATQALLAGDKQGSGLARIPKEALEKTPIPLPPLDQQRLIAGLALSLEDEQKLLKQLGWLKDRVGREVLGRAIRSAEAPISRRSA
jgi:hypothetical protein